MTERKDTYYLPNLQQTVDAGEFSSQRDVEIMALKKMAGKNNNAFIMGMRNLDEQIPLGMFDGYLEKKAKEQNMPGMGSSVWEATKGLGEGFAKAPVRYIGYLATNSLPLIAKSATSLYALSGAAGGKESADKFIREANKGIESFNNEMKKLTGIDDASTLEEIVGGALGSVSAGVAGGGFSAPAFGLSALQDTYTRQREAGTGVGESLVRGAIHGTGEWYLEKLQLNRIFGALAKKSKPIAIVKDVLENAMQEGLQQANEQGANWNIDHRSLIEKLQEIGVSMVGGAVASLGGSIGGIVLNRKTINEVGDLMKKTGRSNEEIQSVKDSLNKIVDSNELQQAANMVANDELTTVALTYKEQAKAASEELVKNLEDTISRNELVDLGGELSGDKTVGMPPLYQLGELQIDTKQNPHLGMVLYQAEQEGQPIQTLGQVLEWTKGKLNIEESIRMNTGINAVYTKTYEQLKSFGQNDQLADANARIRSAMAFSISNKFGVSVEDADNMLGGIVSQKSEDFGKTQTESFLPGYKVSETKYSDLEEELKRKGNNISEETFNKIKNSLIKNNLSYEKTGEELENDLKKENLSSEDFMMVVDYLTTPNETLYQDEQEKNLVVLHSITERNLSQAIDFGGLAVPSLAITKKDVPFDFAESGITLVGNKEMIDPKFSKNKVFNRDVWTKTFPFPTYKKVSNKKYYDFKNNVIDYFRRSGSPNELGSLLYHVERGYSPERAVEEFINSDGAKIMYIETQLKEKVDVPMRDAASDILETIKRYGIQPTEEFIEEISKFESMPSVEQIKKEIIPVINKAIDKNVYVGKEEKYAQKLRDVSKQLFTDSLAHVESVIRRAKEYLETKGSLEVDKYALRDIIDEKITNKEDYYSWAEKYIEDNLVGEKMVEIGKRLLPFNLENVVKYMTKGITKNAQEGFVYGSGKVVAAGAKQLKSIKEIKIESKKLTTKEEQKVVMESLEKDMDTFSNYFITVSDFTNSMYQKEAAFRALGSLAELENPTKEKLQSFLNYELSNKTIYDDEVLESGVKIAKSVRNIVRNYFEVKPQRAVMLNEFVSAIIPTSEKYDKIAKKVEQSGLSVVRSDNQTDALNKIQESGKDIFFQQDGQKPLGAYYNNTVYLFENANETTFLHENSHAYMDVLVRLAQDGNAQAQKDLDIIRNWLGKSSAEQFTQTDWEKFARGFETYVREGKAPNKYLGGVGGVFDRFKSWLMDIYAGIKFLKTKNEKGKYESVKINRNIKNFYDEMLGGEDIDSVIENAQNNDQSISVLQNKLQQLSDIQQLLVEERAKIVREMAKDVKPDTTWANVKDWGKNVLESASELPKFVLESSANRLSKIDKRLGLLVQRVEQSQGLRLKAWSDQIKPFYDAFNKLSSDDKAKVQFYLLNQQWGDVSDIIGQENTESVRGMLETIYNELANSGVEVGYRENYFPRSVLDYDGLLEEMGLTYPSLRKEMESAIGQSATPQEQAEWLDKHIMSFKGNVSTRGNRNTKERKLDLITPAMSKFYKPSMETLVDYMQGMAKLLSMRDAFGKNIEYKEGNKESSEDSIGKIINNLFGENKLSKKEIDEVRQVLSALYLPNGVGNKFLQAMRQYGYATKLSYSTTIRQFADIGMMMKVNGVLNTLDALFHPDKRISLETLGIDPLGEEFQTSKKEIGGKIASISTKWKGINWADAVMKNAYLRGSYKSLQKLAETPDKFHQKYDALFGDETDTLISDLKNDNLSEPVKVLLFHEISKIQPISRSAMPTAYLSNPNGRVFYMFKTFSLHRAEYMVSEIANDFRNGDMKKAGKDIMADVAVIGWEGLVELLIAFLKYGWQAFATEAVLETFAGSGLGVLGLNKHQALQISRGQIGDFFQQMIGVGTPIDDIGYMIRHYDKDDKLLRAFLPDIILEPLIVGPKDINNKSKKVK